MKNNNFINQQKYLTRQLNDSVPALYASLAIALHECEVDNDDISYLFAKSEKIWTQNTGDITSLLIECYQKTGIQLMEEKQYKKAVEQGLIDDSWEIANTTEKE